MLSVTFHNHITASGLLRATYYPNFRVFGLQEEAQEPQEHPKFMHKKPAEHILDVSQSQDKSDPENIWTE